MAEQRTTQKGKKTFNKFKDYNVAERTLVIRIFIGFFAPFSLIAIALYFARLPWYLAPIAAVVCTCLLLLFLKYVGKAIGYATGHVSTTTLREQLTADIDRIKYHMQNKNYDEALKIAENVLEKDPEFPEALFFKGQLLYQGLGLETEAKEALLKVMMLVPREEQLHQWALNLRKRIIEAENLEA